MRPSDDLGYTESMSRPIVKPQRSMAGISSSESKALEASIEEKGKRAMNDHGRFYLENATATEF